MFRVGGRDESLTVCGLWGWMDTRSWVQGQIWDVNDYSIYQLGNYVKRWLTLYMLISPSLPPVPSLSPLLCFPHFTFLTDSSAFVRGVEQIRGVMDGLFHLAAYSCRVQTHIWTSDVCVWLCVSVHIFFCHQWIHLYHIVGFFGLFFILLSLTTN